LIDRSASLTEQVTRIGLLRSFSSESHNAHWGAAGDKDSGHIYPFLILCLNSQSSFVLALQLEVPLGLGKIFVNSSSKALRATAAEVNISSYHNVFSKDEKA
jgi:hypothetical protein